MDGVPRNGVARASLGIVAPSSVNGGIEYDHVLFSSSLASNVTGSSKNQLMRSPEARQRIVPGRPFSRFVKCSVDGEWDGQLHLLPL